MRISRFVTALAISAGAVLGLTACDDPADQLVAEVPINVEELQAAEPGASLTALGYIPVQNLYAVRDGKLDKSKVVGAVYVACGDNVNLSVCSADRLNRATDKLPNVFVVNGKVTLLQGHYNRDVNRNYQMKVPEGLQDFGALTDDQQKKLIGSMVHVVKLLGQPEDQEWQTLKIKDIGLVEGSLRE